MKMEILISQMLLSEVTSIYDLNKDEVEALKEKYDDDCNNYKGF